jgi:endonuclease/exonuclease/phosphatase family metal-dependent hydrolase
MKLAFALLAWLGSLSPTPAIAADGPTPISALSINVLHGGHWSGFAGNGRQLERRMELLAEQLAALRPDVIALQEAVVSRRLGHVPELLARRLGLHHVYAPATTRIFGDGLLSRLVVGTLGFREGPAVLSRFPILESEVYELPRCLRQIEPRVLLRARLDTPRGPLDVFSVHVARDGCQVRRVTEVVTQRRHDLPSIVMGDFNASETSEAIRALTGDAGFVDAYRRANPGALGATGWQNVDAPESTARRRIDYVFLVPGREVRGDVVSSRVVLDVPHRFPDGRTLWPSDHYGVLAELTW